MDFFFFFRLMMTLRKTQQDKNWKAMELCVTLFLSHMETM